MVEFAPMNIGEILAGCQFVALRYEGPHVECTGITAVAKQELRAFHGRGGVMVMPWSGEMKSARDALMAGKVRETEVRFPVAVNADTIVDVRVLLAQAADSAPVMYLKGDGFFRGVESPYDTPNLNRDALFFGLAVKALLSNRVGPRAWVWAADWQTVPAAVLLHYQYVTAITLHNTFDSYLGDGLWQFGELRYNLFRHRTAVAAALETCDVVTTVNRGYAFGLKNEVFHRQIMAEHLQASVGRIIGIDNANFAEPTQAMRDLANLLETDPSAGRKRLDEMQKKAASALPAELAEKTKGKALAIAMGRRSSQKLHDVVVEAVRIALANDPNLPLFVFFATTHSDTGSPARLERIKQLFQEFPNNAGWSDGRVPYFMQLMEAGSFNLLLSLWEPHGGAFEATIVPIARAVDGLAAQIVPLDRTGAAGAIADHWHPRTAAPNGFTFREDPPESYLADLRELLEQSPAPPNLTSRLMAQSLAATLRRAIDVRMNHPDDYARLVLAAIRTQERRSWLMNLGGMLALVEAARLRRG